MNHRFSVGVHHEIQEPPEIADAKPSKGLINLFGGLSFYPEFPDEGDVCDDPALSPEEQVRCDANDDVDPTDVLQCEIDGVPLQDLFSYRAETPEGGSHFPSLKAQF